MMNVLFEILVPTVYGNGGTIPKKVHQEWDTKIQKQIGGLTILAPSKGKWEFNNEEFHEVVIPVRIMCPRQDMLKIVDFTLKFFQQKAVMYYVLTEDVHIVYAKECDS